MQTCRYIVPINSLTDAILRIRPCVPAIEIIDIECVLLAFLSRNFVSTKWRISKGISTSSNLLCQGISRGQELVARGAEIKLMDFRALTPVFLPDLYYRIQFAALTFLPIMAIMNASLLWPLLEFWY